MSDRTKHKTRNFEVTSQKYLPNVKFCDILHESKQKKHKQTQESLQYRLEIMFTWQKLSKRFSLQHANNFFMMQIKLSRGDNYW